MALHTMGTNATSSLVALQWFPGLTTTSSAAAKTLALSDVQNFNDQILSTALIGAFLNQTGAAGIVMTATTTSNTALATLASVAGPPLSAVQPGDIIIGGDIPAGTYIVARNPTTGTPTGLTMSANASNSAAGQHFVIVKGAMATYGNAFQAGLDPATGRVKLPDNRGYIQLNPGDYIAVDNTGAVIVVPVNSVSYTGTVWTFT
jgi:hypothetical protein